ncbi:MAG: arsenate reductase ArsC [Myxococcales bacterium]|nr:arsenate reductase ArsC [Myxococcales bacterium]
MTVVVFACVHNAGRSQMAAAFFNQRSDPSRARAISAGSEPAAGLHPEVVAAMAEVGIDLSEARPRKLSPALLEGASFLITMGCGDACPTAPDVERQDWPLPDPKGQSVDRVRAIREEIRSRVEEFAAANGLMI